MATRRTKSKKSPPLGDAVAAKKVGTHASVRSKGMQAPDRRNAVRRSVSLDADIDAMAHNLAGSGDFSSFVNEALRRDIQRTQMLGLLRDLDDEFGPVSESARAKAEELWLARSRSIPVR